MSRITSVPVSEELAVDELARGLKAVGPGVAPSVCLPPVAEEELVVVPVKELVPAKEPTLPVPVAEPLAPEAAPPVDVLPLEREEAERRPLDPVLA